MSYKVFICYLCNVDTFVHKSASRKNFQASLIFQKILIWLVAKKREIIYLQVSCKYCMAAKKNLGVWVFPKHLKMNRKMMNGCKDLKMGLQNKKSITFTHKTQCTVAKISRFCIIIAVDVSFWYHLDTLTKLTSILQWFYQIIKILFTVKISFETKFSNI